MAKKTNVHKRTNEHLPYLQNMPRQATKNQFGGARVLRNPLENWGNSSPQSLGGGGFQTSQSDGEARKVPVKKNPYKNESEQTTARGKLAEKLHSPPVLQKRKNAKEDPHADNRALKQTTSKSKGTFAAGTHDLGKMLEKKKGKKKKAQGGKREPTLSESAGGPRRSKLGRRGKALRGGGGGVKRPAPLNP